jgi:hypothetical protein
MIFFHGFKIFTKIINWGLVKTLNSFIINFNSLSTNSILNDKLFISKITLITHNLTLNNLS